MTNKNTVDGFITFPSDEDRQMFLNSHLTKDLLEKGTFTPARTRPTIVFENFPARLLRRLMISADVGNGEVKLSEQYGPLVPDGVAEQKIAAAIQFRRPTTPATDTSDAKFTVIVRCFRHREAEVNNLFAKFAKDKRIVRVSVPGPVFVCVGTLSALRQLAESPYVIQIS